MKKIKKLKINNLGKELNKEKMQSTKGGDSCWCCCYYANTGGSSTYWNGHANCQIQIFTTYCNPEDIIGC